MTTINYNYRGIIPYELSFCYNCGVNLSGVEKVYLCDYTIDPYGKDPNKRECNRKMCLSCSNNISPFLGIFLCDQHFKENQQEIESFNSSRLEYEHKRERDLVELKVDSLQEEIDERIPLKGHHAKLLFIDNSPEISMLSNLIPRFRYTLVILKYGEEIEEYDIELNFEDVVNKIQLFLSSKGEIE